MICDTYDARHVDPASMARSSRLHGYAQTYRKSGLHNGVSFGVRGSSGFGLPIFDFASGIGSGFDGPTVSTAGIVRVVPLEFPRTLGQFGTTTVWITIARATRS